jgi:hypothetical protein
VSCARPRLAGGALCVVLIAGCGSATSTQNPSGSGRSPATPPGQRSSLTAQVADSECPNDKGAAINTQAWTAKAADNGNAFPTLAAAMRTNGNTLVVASSTPTRTLRPPPSSARRAS